jgi:hypothetical protein
MKQPRSPYPLLVTRKVTGREIVVTGEAPVKKKA